MKKILIANIFGIGDVLFTTPLAASLREAYPGVTIDYLSNARTRDLVSWIPGVDNVHVYEKDAMVDLWRKDRKEAVRSAWSLFSSIKTAGYDAVFDITMSRRFSFFFMLAGIPRRIGPDYKGRGFFLTDKVKLDGFEDKHVAEHYLDLARKIGLEPSPGRMDIRVPEEEKARASRYLKSRSLDEKKLVAVIPGGGASWGKHSGRKRWSADGFARTAEVLARSGWDILVLGDDSEYRVCEDVAKGVPSGKTVRDNSLNLKDYAAILSKARLVLCNDGGPLHIAVSLGVSTVSIFGPVDPVVYGPYPVTDNHRVVTIEGLPCRPCYGRFRLPECGFGGKCLAGIDPERVGKICLELLEKS